MVEGTTEDGVHKFVPNEIVLRRDGSVTFDNVDPKEAPHTWTVIYPKDCDPAASGNEPKACLFTTTEMEPEDSRETVDLAGLPLGEHQFICAVGQDKLKSLPFSLIFPPHASKQDNGTYGGMVGRLTVVNGYGKGSHG